MFEQLLHIPCTWDRYMICGLLFGCIKAQLIFSNSFHTLIPNKNMKFCLDMMLFLWYPCLISMQLFVIITFATFSTKSSYWDAS